MAKEVLAQIKLQIEGGKANPAPPVGPALGQRQVNIMEFCKQFNAATSAMGGLPCPTIITVYKDKSFTFIVKKPPMTYYVKKAAKITSGSKTPGRGGGGCHCQKGRCFGIVAGKSLRFELLWRY